MTDPIHSQFLRDANRQIVETYTRVGRAQMQVTIMQWAIEHRTSLEAAGLVESLLALCSETFAHGPSLATRHGQDMTRSIEESRASIDEALSKKGGLDAPGT